MLMCYINTVLIYYTDTVLIKPIDTSQAACYNTSIAREALTMEYYDEREIKRMTKAELIDYIGWLAGKLTERDETIDAQQAALNKLNHAEHDKHTHYVIGANKRWQNRRLEDGKLDVLTLDEVLRRKAKGESWRKLADAYHVNYSSLARLARKRAEHLREYGRSRLDLPTDDKEAILAEGAEAVAQYLATHADLAAVLDKHRAAADDYLQSKLAEPVAVFAADGCGSCVMYACGSWWHYDLSKGEWY